MAGGGELDYQAAEPLALALAAAVRLDGDIVLNMSALSFADAPSTVMIADAALTAAAGRLVTVQGRTGVAMGLAGVGIAAMPGIRLVTTGEQ